ncbi:hypothetical protein GCM10010994_19750 [Chelatococcus reniformis]|uniref:Uncharacterized protein n=1 Tax=Chelatococcus reniformis TaxID=1494448 RepID=A0A916U630_9HYPH|nr:hypothetical protein GCM10010994_19750 [Chelatococcus reniformis]
MIKATGAGDMAPIAGSTAAPTLRIHCCDPDLSHIAQPLHRYTGAVPAQHQVNRRLPEPLIAQQDPVPVWIELEAQHGLEEQMRRAGSPGLGRAGRRVERGAPPLTPRWKPQ